MNLVDTSGWLEYFADTPSAKHFAKAIENTSTLIVPTIVLYEVFKKVRTQLGEDKAFVAVAQLKLGVVVAVDEAVALLAAKLSSDHKLPMADALIYATAQLRGATVYTQDAHFRELPGVRYFEKANDVLPS
ncbi:MAG TPA: type II toxin-antitoxin system VapC family toxin [Casimicrobium huifangae]|nr:type II toxin-antitoxin system VapC family toxin [Casimicrobium huifangae]HQA35599.1 type II toxin-antitoxin system VapC family toxin [Casimicrobium huifangae]